MADRTQRTTATSMRTVVDPKMSLSLWLRAGRAAKGMSLEDVAKITKIQPRILERLEAGKLEGLPAEVFVRGFVRSYARCCGLDETEALERYALAAGQPTAPSAAVTRANALVESMSELAPATASRGSSGPRVLTDVQLATGSLTDLPRSNPAETVVQAFLPMSGTLVDARIVEDKVEDEIEETIEAPIAVATAVEAATPAAAPTIEETPVVIDVAPLVEDTSKKKRGRRGGKGRKRKQIADGTPSSPTPVVAEAIVAEGSVSTAIVATSDASTDSRSESTIETSTESTMASTIASTIDVSMGAAAGVEEPTTTESWSPKMPVVMPSVPWRRPTSTLTSTAPKSIVPSIVIDDADPDSAEREIEDRAAAKEPARRSFLPPILLDREDRSARQGGLTLAVIILLIAATLTLSYLMRRPSSTGDGVTMIESQASSQIIA